MCKEWLDVPIRIPYGPDSSIRSMVMGFLVLYLLYQQSVCDPATMRTGNGHECIVVEERKKPIPAYMITKYGRFPLPGVTCDDRRAHIEEGVCVRRHLEIKD
jgi:hypothetical protein